MTQVVTKNKSVLVEHTIVVLIKNDSTNEKNVTLQNLNMIATIFKENVRNSNALALFAKTEFVKKLTFS